MKRAYEVRVSRLENWQAETFIVVATSDEIAIRKAKAQAAKLNGVDTGWRCTKLEERSTELVS